MVDDMTHLLHVIGWSILVFLATGLSLSFVLFLAGIEMSEADDRGIITIALLAAIAFALIIY